MALMPVDEALARILVGAAPSGDAEMTPLAESLGRVLADDLPALRTHPPFAASAMDGYAVRAAEAVVGAALKLQGEAAAGHGFDGALEPGSAIRIFTGAPVPQGADAIVIQEVVDRLEDGTVRINEAAVEGRHIRRAGVDFEEGMIGLEAGRVMDPGAITFAAAMNHARLPLFRRPRVAILATGDELRLPGQPLGPGQIIASNTFGVAALARGAGAEIIDLGIAADSMEALDEALDSAIAHEADVLVREPNESVMAAWRDVYYTNKDHWGLYELAEDLIDMDDLFQTWRFRHRNAVERVIGHKIGTGGTSGVGYLTKATEIRLFPELWAARTEL